MGDVQQQITDAAAAAAAAGQGHMQPLKPYAQLASFAPSKQDILQALEYFFGQPAQPEKVHDFSDHHAATGHLPDAYQGKSVGLRDTLNNLILSSPEDWQTTVMLPWMQIDGVTVSWDEVHFDVRMLQRVPYEGASRMQTSMRRSHRDRVVRRGIALMVESDFYRNEAGRKYFQDQVLSIRYCVQETANYDVLFALLTCHNYDFHWDISKNLLPHRNIVAAMKHDITMYASVQKNPSRGLDLAVEKGKQRMARYHTSPNSLIMAPETQLYLSMVPNEKIDFSFRGERGPAQYDAYEGNKSIPSFRGLRVYTTNPYDAGDNTPQMQMLRRQTQVGEFYVMKPPMVWGKNQLPGSYMDICIFDEQKDRRAHITCRAALEHAMPWNLGMEDDYLKIKENSRRHEALIRQSIRQIANKEGVFLAKGEPAKYNDEGNLTEAAKPYEGSMDKAIAFLTKEFDYSYQHFQTLVLLIECGVWVPLHLVIARPFIEHHMLSAIMVVAGKDTGATLFGPADMQISANTAVKVIEGHYTCHTKAVITRPQNVMVLRDIQCDGYVAGSDVTWFGDISSKNREPLTKEHIRQDLTSRLDFEHEHDNHYASMFAFAVPMDENAQYMQDMAFSLTNSNLPWDVGNGTEESHRNFPGGNPFFDKYSELFGFGQIHDGSDPQSISSNDYIRNGSYNNAICIIGPHRGYSPFTETMSDLTAGQGHFGADAQPGDARWRRGESIDVESARGSLVGIEAYADSAKSVHRLGSKV